MGPRRQPRWPRSSEVRRFFIENALHWVHEYHIDGLRLDATHAIQDDSPVHFLAELTSTVRERTDARSCSWPRTIATSRRCCGRSRRAAGASTASGPTTSTIRCACTPRGDREGYYADFTGTTEDLAATLRQGWFFTGQHSGHLDEPRGTDPSGLPPAVRRLHSESRSGRQPRVRRPAAPRVDAAAFRALSALLLVAPQTPLLFMGQEWAASSPFLFFTDHEQELGRKVTEGRRQEFGAFAAFADPVGARRFPIRRPRRPSCAAACSGTSAQRDPHAGVRRLYQRLLQHPRHQRRDPNRDARTYDVRALDEHSLMLTLRCGAEAGRARSHRHRAAHGRGRRARSRRGPTGVTYVTTEDVDVTTDPRRSAWIRRHRSPCTSRRPGAIVLRASPYRRV